MGFTSIKQHSSTYSHNRLPLSNPVLDIAALAREPAARIWSLFLWRFELEYDASNFSNLDLPVGNIAAATGLIIRGVGQICSSDRFSSPPNILVSVG